MRIRTFYLPQYGGEVFDTYVKEQNAIIDKFANLVAQRKGIVKKGEKAEEKE